MASKKAEANIKYSEVNNEILVATIVSKACRRRDRIFRVVWSDTLEKFILQRPNTAQAHNVDSSPHDRWRLLGTYDRKEKKLNEYLFDDIKFFQKQYLLRSNHGHTS